MTNKKYCCDCCHYVKHNIRDGVGWCGNELTWFTFHESTPVHPNIFYGKIFFKEELNKHNNCCLFNSSLSQKLKKKFFYFSEYKNIKRQHDYHDILFDGTYNKTWLDFASKKYCFAIMNGNVVGLRGDSPDGIRNQVCRKANIELTDLCSNNELLKDFILNKKFKGE